MSDNHTHSHEGHTHEGHTHHNPEEAAALLKYMIDHNKHHGEDLHEICHALADAGKNEAAELVHKAMHIYEDGNEALEQALKLL